ncbi:MAG: hypothetical protein AAGA44_12145 [Pseudomonadota bacterium]
MTNRDKIKDGILNSGFPLEFLVGKACRSHGWSTINSKYYVDDTQGKARELDVVAYKIGMFEDVQVCTTLLISCKKNKHDAWSLIAQEKDERDPNKDWYPMHGWSNQPVMNFVLSETEWVKSYIQKAKDKEFFSTLIEPEHHIFAYQLQNKDSGKVHGSSSVFDSVTALMKAQWYEIDSRQRNKEAQPSRVMLFNLLTVADAELLLCLLDQAENSDVEVSISEVDTDTHIASFIVDQKEATSRVNFVRFSALEDVLTKFDSMHSFNRRFFADASADYFAHPFESKEATAVFLDQFVRQISISLRLALRGTGEDLEGRIDLVEISRRRGADYVSVGVPFIEDATISALNEDERLRARTRDALEEFYRYHGDFKYEMGFPF